MADITSRDNPGIKQIVRLSSSRKAREEAGLFVCEGAVMLSEAINSGAEVRDVFCLEGTRVPAGGFKTVTVTESVMAKLSTLENAPGPVFTVAMPEKKSLCGRIIAVERLSDPGNLGTVIRTADAFGFDAVALLGECADPFSPKTVRATMGAIFRTDTIFTDINELCVHAQRENKKLIAAVLDRNARSVVTYDCAGCVFIVGNEAAGLSAETVARCDGKVFIPIGSSESLNAAVAASVLMWESVR